MALLIRMTGRLVAGILLAGMPGWCAPSLEYQVKAAFLYNFAKFIEWPEENPGVPLSICVLGQDPFGPLLDQMVEGKSIRGRALVVRRAADPAGLRSCGIVFVGATEMRHLGTIAKAAEAVHALTVGENDEFARTGGMIGFVLVDNKIRFEINVDAATRARLRISSQLLQVAHLVHDGRARGN